MKSLLLFSLQLVDVAADAGVTLVNLSGEQAKEYIVEVNGNGAAFFDYDDDLYGTGCSFGDYDNDGWLDIVVTNFSHETNTLDRGADGIFNDVTNLVGLGGSSIAALGWGVGLVDLDNDGWRDLFVANGHVYPEVDDAPIGTSWLQKKQLFRNRQGRFEEITAAVGGPLLRETSSRGVAFGDYDDDGDQDIFIVNLDEAPSLLRNETAGENHWLRLRLVGREGNRGAVGARVKLGAQLTEVRSGGSYLSHNDSRPHFGVGGVTSVERIEVRWPGGKLESFEGVASDRQLTIVEGVGIVDESR